MAPNSRQEATGQISFEEALAQQEMHAVVRSAQEQTAERAMDATDVMPAVMARAVYSVSATAPDVIARRESLIKTLDSINEANKRVGIASMSDSHPKAGVLDRQYGKGNLENGRKRIEANIDKHDTQAKVSLEVACGQCAVESCGLRKNYPAFLRKYKPAPTRNKFAKKLNNNPAEPC